MSGLRVWRDGDGWAIQCARCEEARPFTFTFKRWARATTWETAIAVADLHVRLHRESDCSRCGHGPAIEHPNQLRAGLVEIGDRVFMQAQRGFTELRLSGATS